MTRLFFSRLALLVSLTLPITTCEASDTWVGTYLYEAELGESISNTPVIIEYELALDSSICKLDITGYQINESIQCTSAQEEGKLVINFHSYDNGKIKNIYGVQIYKVGSSLFSLEMKGDSLVTTWQALLPDEKLDKSGKYFKRIN